MPEQRRLGHWPGTAQGRGGPQYQLQVSGSLSMMQSVPCSWRKGRNRRLRRNLHSRPVVLHSRPFEARLQHFPSRGAFGGVLRPFVHVAAGISEESAELKLGEPRSGDGRPIESVSGRGPITLIHAVGMLFAGGGFGGSLRLFEVVRLEAELSGFVAFPSTGWFARPAIGLSYDF